MLVELEAVLGVYDLQELAHPATTPRHRAIAPRHRPAPASPADCDRWIESSPNADRSRMIRSAIGRSRVISSSLRACPPKNQMSLRNDLSSAQVVERDPSSAASFGCSRARSISSPPSSHTCPSASDLRSETSVLRCGSALDDAHGNVRVAQSVGGCETGDPRATMTTCAPSSGRGAVDAPRPARGNPQRRRAISPPNRQRSSAATPRVLLDRSTSSRRVLRSGATALQSERSRINEKSGEGTFVLPVGIVRDNHTDRHLCKGSEVIRRETGDGRR